MKQKTHYTIGEIFRLGLLKNHRGEPYSHQSAVSTALRRAGIVGTLTMTPFGMARVVSRKDIESYNRRWPKNTHE